VSRRVLILVALLGMASTYFQVVWVDSSHTAVTIRAPGARQEVAECLEGGREAKLRFQVRLCRKRQSWLDACASERTQHHSISYDSITESYKVIKDRLGDDADPVAVGMPSREDAVNAAISAENVPFSFLARDESNLLGHEQGYLQARMIFVCKGSINRTIGQLSQILTFGILNVVESDSGWLDFSVHSRKAGDESGEAK
jgi:hypothetical protein